MKKIIFTFYISLSAIFCSAQNYEWQPIIPGIDCDDSVYAKCRIGLLVNDTFHNTLWCIGRFQGGGGIQSERVVGFNGINWIAFPGVYDSVLVSKTICAIMYNGNLVIGKTNGVDIFNFSSQSWSTIGTSNDDVNCLAVYNGQLISGGRFTNMDGMSRNGIAQWDGTQWLALGGGITGSTHIVDCFEVYNNKLYVGGSFDYCGNNIDAWNIASWDGNNWNNLCSTGSSFGTDRLSGNHSAADVYSMEVFNNKLYIIGSFEKVCNINCYLAYWDDTTWTGTSYPYFQGESITCNTDKLIVESYGGTTFPNHHFYWNGTQAMAVDSGFEAGGSNDLKVFQNIFYSGGGFDLSGNTPVFRIARLMVSPHVYVSLSVCTGSTYDFNGTMLTNPGVYTDTLMDASGLDSIVTLTLSFVTINPAISISNDTLTATGNGTIQWYNCNTHAFINTQTGNTFVLSNTGSYAAIFTNGNCIDTTDCITYTGVNGVPPNAEANVLQIYPNPSTEEITIELTHQNKNCRIEICNLLGEIVVEQQIKKQITQVNIKNLLAGIYILKVSNDEWSEVFKFVKN